MKIVIIEDNYNHYQCIVKMLKDTKNGLVIDGQKVEIIPKNENSFIELRNNINMTTSCDEKTSEEAKIYLKDFMDGVDYAVIDYKLNEDNKYLNGLEIYKVVGFHIKAMIYTNLVASKWDEMNERIISEGFSDNIKGLQKPALFTDVCMYEKNLMRFISEIKTHYMSDIQSLNNGKQSIPPLINI